MVPTCNTNECVFANQDDEDHPCAELDPYAFWGEEFPAPNCVLYKLQEVEFNEFGGSDNEVLFLKFLFKSGFVLRTIRLRVAREGTWMQYREDLVRILRCWRSKSRSVYELNILIE